MKEISSIIPPSRRDCKFSRIASWRDLTELNRPSRSFGASIELTVGRLLLTLPFALYLKTHKHTYTTETLVWCVCVLRGDKEHRSVSQLFVIQPGFPYTHLFSSYIITLLFLV